MFGGPAAAPALEWGEMHFHQKLQHLADATCDFVCGKANWWVPVVSAGAALSLFFFGQEQFIDQGHMLVSLVASPFPATPAFGAPMGEEGELPAPMHEDGEFADLDD